MGENKGSSPFQSNDSPLRLASCCCGSARPQCKCPKTASPQNPIQVSLGETRMSSRATLLEALELSFPVSGDCFISWLQHSIFKSLSDLSAQSSRDGCGYLDHPPISEGADRVSDLASCWLCNPIDPDLHMLGSSPHLPKPSLSEFSGVDQVQSSATPGMRDYPK